MGKLGSALYKCFNEAIEQKNELKKLQKIYQRLLARCSSEVVSLDKKPNRKPKLTKIWEVIETIENNLSQIWKWLGLIGEKIGIAIAPDATPGEDLRHE